MNNIYANVAGNTTLYAKWTANSYTCSAGKYLSGTTCSDCESGYYCAGGTWTYDGGVQGRGACPSDFPLTDPRGGATSNETSINGCWRDCNASDTPNSTSRTGWKEYGGNNTCAATACAAGYYLDNGTCKACDSGYTSGSGMTSGRAYCYKTCASKTGYTLTGGVDYYSATDTCSYSANTYKVTLDKQSGTGGTNEYYYKYQTDSPCYYYTDSSLSTCMGSDSYTLTKPTRTGYTFGGYYTGTNGTGSQYIDANGQGVNNLWSAVAANSTLYAYWVPNIYKVSLDKQSGTGGTSEYYYKYQTDSPCYYYTSSSLSSCVNGGLGATITPPTRTGYTFGGYYTGTNGTGTQYVDAGGGTMNNIYANVAGNTTLYAKWTANSYTCSAGKYLNGTTCSDCESGYWCPGATWTYNGSVQGRQSCSTSTETRYPNSAAGSDAITDCYSNTKSRAWSGSQTACPKSDGCDVTCNTCSIAACDYVAYSNSAGTGDGTIKSGCSSNSAACQQTVKSRSAQENHYLSGTTCPSCPSGYPNSIAGATAITQCYSNTKQRAWSGEQIECDTPSGCESATCESCSRDKCSYVAYSNSAGTGDGTIKSGCETNNESCKQSVASVTASSGNYVSGTTCPACTNKPDNSYYTGTASSNACPWECNDGYNLTSDNQCGQFCDSGITHIHLSTGLKVPLYTSARTAPAINVLWNDTICYGSLAAGAGSGLNVKYNGTTYHAID